MLYTGGTEADRGSGVSLARLVTRSWAAAVCLVACCIAINVTSFELQRATFGTAVDHLSNARAALERSLAARQAENRYLRLASATGSQRYVGAAEAEAAVAASDELDVQSLTAGKPGVSSSVATVAAAAGSWSTWAIPQPALGTTGPTGTPAFPSVAASTSRFDHYKALESSLADMLSSRVNGILKRQSMLTATAAVAEAVLVLLFAAGAWWQLGRMRRAVVHPVDQLLDAMDDVAKGLAPRAIGPGSLTELIRLRAGLGGMAQSRDDALSHLGSAEQQLRQIMETATEAFICTDRSGTVLRWNGEAERLLGWPPEQAIGASLASLVLPEDLRDGYERCLRSCETGDAREPVEAVLRHRDGRDVEIEATLWVTEHADQKLFNAFVHDVSRKRQAERSLRTAYERQLEAADRLREVDKIRSEFVYTVSHELRTPLTSIIGYIDMLTDGSVGPLAEDQAHLLGVAERNSRRLLRLIEDLLALSKIEQGSFRVNTVPSSLNRVVENATDSIGPSLDARRIDIRLELDASDTPADIDCHQIERVLVNLLSNSVKFTPDGGSIRIRTFPAAAGMVVSVADTGMGIPIEEQPNLFTPFFRSYSARTGAIQGTGLGLSIVKSIVTAHRGTVSIDSAPGSGTTVTVCLPYGNIGSATDSEPETRLQEEAAA